ncbi:hypothetical protein I4U23_011412 [Adineta vaga]|nr:hypothetical protein I4U23_011412 [Adineta vaga]
MNLELLPNEIFIQCLQYLNAIDVFYSFDQLNDRFNVLIRSISLSLNFNNVYQRFLCDQFCDKMLKDSQIKEQIRSLYLSNKNTCYPIHLFLSKFSLLEFPYLHSLTMTHVNDNIWKQIQSTLPLMSQLTFFRNKDSCLQSSSIPDLPLSQMQTLMLETLLLDATSQIQSSSILHLAVTVCTMPKFYELLNDLPKLMYLKINRVIDLNEPMDMILINEFSTKNNKSNLTQLHIDYFESEFSCLEAILRQTSKLKKLTIGNDIDHTMANAQRWEELISSSLPHLNIFKFEFRFSEQRSDKILEIFNQFQNDFWCKQHHWYTDYFLFTKSSSIYTIPYPFHTFEYTGEMKESTNKSIKHVNSFDNVTNLTIFPQMLIENSQYYFPNVLSLTIEQKFESWNGEYYKMTDQNAKCLLEMVNLSNIKHLTINGILFESSTVLKDIIKAASRLYSFYIQPDVLLNHFDDVKLCNYLTKLIRKLHIFDSFYDNLKDLEKFCGIFGDLEELWCDANESNILFLIQHLRNLRYLDVHGFQKCFHVSEIVKEAQMLGLDITCNPNGDDFTNCLSIWINRISC